MSTEVNLEMTKNVKTQKYVQFNTDDLIGALLDSYSSVIPDQSSALQYMDIMFKEIAKINKASGIRKSRLFAKFFVDGFVANMTKK